MAEANVTQTILVIDDETDVREVSKLLFEREGFRVLTASNGQEGMLLAKVNRPDVILLDVLMPTMDGYATLRVLKDDPDTCHIPVIMVTARRTEKDFATSFRLGAVSYVEKPYLTADLLRKIKAATVLSAGKGGQSTQERDV